MNFTLVFFARYTGCYVESVNWWCIFISGWLACDLLMFGTASYIAFDVSVIMKCACEGLTKCFYYYYYYHCYCYSYSQAYCYHNSSCKSFGHLPAQIVISAWLRSDLGKVWTDTKQSGSLKLWSSRHSTAKSGQWRRYKMCWGGISGVWRSGALTFL